jgi:hypothetical protein
MPGVPPADALSSSGSEGEGGVPVSIALPETAESCPISMGAGGAATKAPAWAAPLAIAPSAAGSIGGGGAATLGIAPAIAAVAMPGLDGNRSIGSGAGAPPAKRAPDRTVACACCPISIGGGAALMACVDSPGREMLKFSVAIILPPPHKQCRIARMTIRGALWILNAFHYNTNGRHTNATGDRRQGLGRSHRCRRGPSGCWL